MGKSFLSFLAAAEDTVENVDSTVDIEQGRKFVR